MTLEEKLAELSARFAARAGPEAEALGQAIVADDRDEVISRAHKLAGVAALMGQPKIGAAALNLEETALDGKDYRKLGERLCAMLAELAAS